jgi:hypothetical protein
MPREHSDGHAITDNGDVVDLVGKHNVQHLVNPSVLFNQLLRDNSLAHRLQSGAVVNTLNRLSQHLEPKEIRLSFHLEGAAVIPWDEVGSVTMPQIVPRLVTTGTLPMR